MDSLESSDLITKFKDRKIKANLVFTLIRIDKATAYNFVRKYHYLKDSRFFSCYNYGLYTKSDNTLVGVTTFSNPQGTMSLKGWFNLNTNCKDILESSRLCVLPSLNGSNVTSYLLGSSIKFLRREGIRAIITLADDSKHVGSIYQVCNFKYYGLTDRKQDFYVNGKIKHRGTTKNVHGVWLDRTRKHRYAYIIDNKLICNYKEQSYPPKVKREGSDTCTYCNGSGKVYDKRLDEWHNCPCLSKS